MGMFTLNGNVVAPGGDNNHKVMINVNVGDTADFYISGGFLPENTYWDGNRQNDINVDDINNAVIRFREEADDALQMSVTIVMIGMTVWIVEGRAREVWGNDVSVHLHCVPTSRSRCAASKSWVPTPARDQIGFVSLQSLTKGIRTDDQGKGTYSYDGDFRMGFSIGPGWFPVMQVNFASARNTRPCDTTEFGLKSQVWNRVDGIATSRRCQHLRACSTPTWTETACSPER